MIVIVMFIITLFLIFLLKYFRRKKALINKRVLVIGGSNGFGKSLVDVLKQNNDVMVADRHPNEGEQFIDILEDEFTIKGNYDVVFCVPGMMEPGYFRDSPEFKRQNEINFYSAIKVLRHCLKEITNSFTFVVIGSTNSIYSYPGTIAYSNSKRSLFYTFLDLRTELQLNLTEKDNLGNKVDIKIFNCCTMKTDALEKEKSKKPFRTRIMEGLGTDAEPSSIARYFINNFYLRDLHSYDWVTYLFIVRIYCETALDYFFFPISVVFVFLARIVLRIVYNKALNGPLAVIKNKFN